MGTKVKRGILKPIQFLSQIFGETTKEPEMQIGLPTDIKHVAHIGGEGQNATAPTWMKEYQSDPNNPTHEEKGTSARTSGSQGSSYGGVEGSSAARDVPSRPRHTRRHKSDETSRKTDGSVGETAEEIRKHRKGRKKSESAGGAQELPSIPKQPHHRRKSKDVKSKVPKAKEKRAGSDDD